MLLPILVVLLVLAGCGATNSARRPSAATLSRSATLDDVPLRLDVARISRVGSIVAVDLRLTNRAPRGGDSFSISDTFSREGSDDLGGVLLLDPQTGRELDPLDDDGVDLYSMDIAGGGSQMLRVAFPAPRGTTADVLVPHFGLFRGVRVN